MEPNTTFPSNVPTSWPQLINSTGVSLSTQLSDISSVPFLGSCPGEDYGTGHLGTDMDLILSGKLVYSVR